jgi:hypothetical protein
MKRKIRMITQLAGFSSGAGLGGNVSRYRDAGTKLGSYEVAAQIGAGGMGQIPTIP